MINQNYDVISVKEFFFILFGAIGMAIYKFLAWIMPKTAEIFYAGVKSILSDVYKQNNKELIAKIDLLADQVKKYKEEKHRIEGENKELRQAIIDKDEDKLDEIRKILNQKL